MIYTHFLLGVIPNLLNDLTSILSSKGLTHFFYNFLEMSISIRCKKVYDRTADNYILRLCILHAITIKKMPLPGTGLMNDKIKKFPIQNLFCLKIEIKNGLVAIPTLLL